MDNSRANRMDVTKIWDKPFCSAHHALPFLISNWQKLKPRAIEFGQMVGRYNVSEF